MMFVKRVAEAKAKADLVAEKLREKQEKRRLSRILAEQEARAKIAHKLRQPFPWQYMKDDGDV